MNSGAPSFWRRLANEEQGFTLIELLIASGLLVVVIGAALSLSETGGRIAQKDVARADAIDAAQSGAARMERELRAATQVLSPTSGSASNSVEFLANVVPAGGGSRTSRRIRYQCDAPSPENSSLHACFRYESDPSTPPGGAGVMVLGSLVNGTSTNQVFRPNASAPTYVGIHLVRSTKNSQGYGYNRPFTFDAGVYLRNVDGGP